MVASEKTLARQSLALDSITEKSSLARWAFVRVVLAGALVLLVDGFAGGRLDSSAVLLGVLSDGNEIVDSGKTQYTAWLAKRRIASANRCSLSPISRAILLSRATENCLASASACADRSKSRNSRRQSACCLRMLPFSCSRDFDWTSGRFGFGAEAFFVVLVVAELVARVRRVVVVVGVGVRRLLALTRNLSIFSSISAMPDASSLAGISVEVTAVMILSASRRTRCALSCAPCVLYRDASAIWKDTVSILFWVCLDDTAAAER